MKEKTYIVSESDFVAYNLLQPLTSYNIFTEDKEISPLFCKLLSILEKRITPFKGDILSINIQYTVEE